MGLQCFLKVLSDSGIRCVYKQFENILIAVNYASANPWTDQLCICIRSGGFVVVLNYFGMSRRIPLYQIYIYLPQLFLCCFVELGIHTVYVHSTYTVCMYIVHINHTAEFTQCHCSNYRCF